MLPKIIIALVLVVVASAAGLWVLNGAPKTDQIKKPATVKRIGIVQYQKIFEPSIKGFKDGLAESGYKEGENVSYDVRLADGNKDKLKEGADYFLNQNVDLIFADSPESASSALNESTRSGKTNIPIVFTNGTNPDKVGIIKSFKSSGNNTTGVAVDFAAITTKKLEFLKRINPTIKKVGVVYGAVSDPTADFNMKVLREAATKFDINLVEYKLLKPPGPLSAQEAQKLVDSLKPGDFDAYFHPAGPVVNFPDTKKVLMGIGKKLKVPTVFTRDFDPKEESWLLSYGHDFFETGKQAAEIAAKVLGGTKPADIPIEYQKKIRLIVDLRAAKEIGVTIPESILAIADKRIE
ncbi:ABC transporter substrate-binding protein [Candidatus Daviesbacteria bacterium]|nr:ABC transporter substrate-binding protein [Candidatus Daviesbacteria bacterium]